MEVINANQFRSRTRGTEPVLSLRKTGLSINKSVLDGLSMPMTNVLHVDFAIDGDQLFMKFRSEAQRTTATFKLATNGKEYNYANKGLSEHLRKLSNGCESPSVPCKVQVNAPTDDGWYPVITTFWKSKI